MEKRFLFPAIVVSFALFLVGVLVCYFWLLPKTILFFFRDTESLGWVPTWTVQQYYSFVTRFTIGFGLAFELPVVVLALVRFGLITYRFMARTRPYAVVLIFILATIITPTPDILTLIAMIDLVRVMVRDVNVPLNEVIAMATENPARAIGLETKGRLIVGADADLVVLSPQLEVVRTFRCGEQNLV